MTTFKASDKGSKAVRQPKSDKVFGRITSAEGQRTVWKSTVSGRVTSRAVKGDSEVTRSRYDR